MKLTGKDASRYISAPDPAKAGLLLYGADAMRVAIKRQDVIKALIGPNGADEMRLTRISGADLRKDPATLIDAMTSQGFFPGPRAILIEDAGDGVSDIVSGALSEWRSGDASIVVAAGQLAAKSSLRKLFENSPSAYAIGVYDDPLSTEEIEKELHRAGAPAPDRGAMADLTALARELDPGDFRQLIEKLAIYKHGDSCPMTSADIEACAPVSTEAEVDAILNAVAESNTAQIGPIMRKLRAQGTNPTSLCIAATNHFRALFTAASDPGGASSGIARMRPPIFGPRRDRMIRQASNWGAADLERALTTLTDTDLQLRSAGQKAPAMELVERALVRLAMTKRR